MLPERNSKIQVLKPVAKRHKLGSLLDGSEHPPDEFLVAV
jgi:hypothetical protein